MMNQIPANAIAETIISLQLENESIQKNIEMSVERMDKNVATITQLEPMAKWDEIIPEPKPIEI